MAEVLWQNSVEKPVPALTVIPRATAVRVKLVLPHSLPYELAGKIIWYSLMLQ